MEKGQAHFFEVSVKGLKHPEMFKKQAVKVADEISEKVGQEAETKILLEPLSIHRGVYKLSIATEIDGNPIVVSKKGKRVHSLLRKAKKVLLKVYKRAQMKKVKRVRKKTTDWNLGQYDFGT